MTYKCTHGPLLTTEDVRYRGGGARWWMGTIIDSKMTPIVHVDKLNLKLHHRILHLNLHTQCFIFCVIMSVFLDQSQWHGVPQLQWPIFLSLHIFT